jgi:hypothetical protein
MAYACPLCFASSGPGVLRAYLVSAFFMIALAWAVIAGIWLYAARVYQEGTEAGDATARVEGPWIQNAAVDFDCETATEQLKASVIGGRRHDEAALTWRGFARGWRVYGGRRETGVRGDRNG